MFDTTFQAGGKELESRELRLGDVVQLFEGPFGTAIVNRIDKKKNLVYFYRPYGTNHDFTYTGGVVCLVGIEEFCRFHDTDEKYHVWKRQILK
jgi:hypothetical protein